MQNKGKTQCGSSTGKNRTRKGGGSSLNYSAVHKPAPGKGGNGGKAGKGDSNN